MWIGVHSSFSGPVESYRSIKLFAESQLNFTISVMQFPQALETVLEALERMRDQNARHPSASRATLARLKDAKAVAVIADTPANASSARTDQGQSPLP